MEASLDTSILVRFATHDVPEQFVLAKALLERRDIRLVVADAAWIELAYALEHHYAMSRPDVADVITSMAGIESVWTNADTIIAACQAYTSHPTLSFADCYLASHAHHVDATPLYTFDKKLATQHEAAELLRQPASPNQEGASA